MGRRLALLLVVAAVACASGTGSVNDLRWYDQPKGDLWQAAIRAMTDIGARIVIQSQTSGTLSGTLDQVELGGQVRIDVSVRDSAGDPGSRSVSSDLRISVRLEGVPNDDPELRTDLTRIRDTYLDAVDHHVALLERMRR